MPDRWTLNAAPVPAPPLSSITPDILGHRDELSTLTGEEVARAITEQRLLERRYEELISVRSQLKVRVCTCVCEDV